MGHLLKNVLLFLYKFKFSEACILLNIDLAPIKDPSFMDFADQTEQLWPDLVPSIKMGLYIMYPYKQGNGLTKLISLKCMFICLKISLLFLYKL